VWIKERDGEGLRRTGAGGVGQRSFSEEEGAGHETA
jgi:hypothetical protein